MKNRKSLLIGFLCMALVFMGIGYSLFSSTLNITGSSQASGTFDVKITDVVVDSNNTSSGASDEMDPIGENYAVTETTLVAEFNAPGDYITYNVTVTNRGTIDAVISIETDTDTSGAFGLSCNITEGTELLANGGTTTFPCTMTFNDNVDNPANVETAHMSVSLKAVQKATYEAPEVVVADDITGTYYPFVMSPENPSEYTVINSDGTGYAVIASEQYPFTYEMDTNNTIIISIMGMTQYHHYILTENNKVLLTEGNDVATTNGGADITPLEGFIYSDGVSSITFGNNGTVTDSNNNEGKYAVVENVLHLRFSGNRYAYDITQDYSSFGNGNTTFIKQN